MNDDRDRGTLILLACITGGLFLVYVSYKTRMLERLKKRVSRSIQATDIDAYDREDQGRVRSLIRRYVNRVKKAGSKVDVYRAKQSFDDAMENVRTSARKLADAQLDAVSEAYDNVLQRYGKPGSEKAAEAASRFAQQIRSAVNRENVRRLLREFQRKVRPEA